MKHKQPYLVGFAGPAGVGKDTAADILAKLTGGVKTAWAAPLKAGLAAMGLPEPADRRKKECLLDNFDFTWRRAAQTLGTEWGRALQDDFWTRLGIAEALRLANTRRGFLGWRSAPRVVIFSDTRFENEAEVIRNWPGGGCIIHLTGGKADLGSDAGHASEAGLIPAADDWVVSNDLRFDHLKSLTAQLQHIAEEI